MKKRMVLLSALVLCGCMLIGAGAADAASQTQLTQQAITHFQQSPPEEDTSYPGYPTWKTWQIDSCEVFPCRLIEEKDIWELIFTPSDEQGRKMSKSLGNGIDPLEIIDQYGADALRMTLMTGNAPGNDMRFYNERVEASRNFANKVWNASRFIMMNMEQALEKTGKDITTPAAADLQPVDKWILSKLNTLVKDVTDNMDHFELGIAVQKVYDFIWDEFCDWYIEMVKPRLYSTDDAVSQNAALWTLKTVLIDALKLLHPYMPPPEQRVFLQRVKNVSLLFFADM